MSDEQVLPLEHGRRLAMMMLALLRRDGGDVLCIDEEDRPGSARMVRINRLCIVEFAADRERSRPRRIELYLIGRAQTFRLDPKLLLFSIREQHFASPPDFSLHCARPPKQWFNEVVLILAAALGREAFAAA